jgi:phage shock protein PspC (stress-responsive transcriptional regulator)
MKKALQITLAGSLFTIEEDAFDRLRGYLDSIKSYFATIPDSQDVVDDIEARVAEQLLESIKEHSNIVTISDVEKVIESMGSVEEITGTDGDSEEKTEEPAPGEQTSSRKLFRNGDDMILAGVASGMAAYFGMDTLVMRILFVVLTLLTSGGFIFAYIALAIFVPKAVTAADKVKMRGGPVTLSSFKETFNEQAQDIKAQGSRLTAKDSAFRTWTENLFRFFGKAIRVLVTIIVKLTGVALIVIPAMIGIGVILVATNLIFNIDSPLIGFSLAEVITGPLYYLLVILAFLVAFIPVVFIISLGVSILSRKLRMSVAAAMTLGGIWIVALILAGTVAFRYIPDAQQRIQSLPEFQETSQTIENLDSFDKLDLNGASRVTIIQGETHKVTVNGKKINVDSIEFKVDDRTLSIDHQPKDRTCFICLGGGRLDIVIEMPNVESIEASGNVLVQSEGIKGASLAIDLNDSSSANLVLETMVLEADMDDAARFSASGVTTNMNLSLSSATRFDGSELEAGNVVVTAKDSSRGYVRAVGLLEITATDASRITYEGTSPKIEQEDSAQVTNASENPTESQSSTGAAPDESL